MSKYNSGSLSAEQYELFTTFANSLNKEQLSWVSGYLSGLTASKSAKFTLLEESVAVSNSTVSSSVSADPLTILYGSRTGNGEGLAEIALKMATERGLKATLKNMGDYKTRDLSAEKNLLIIVSTHGDGVPPFTAKELHEFIFGKRAPQLEGVNYAVLGLGDSSYFQFCKTGKDFDEQLEQLGAHRIVPAISCDVDFDDVADAWLKDTFLAFSGGEIIAENEAPTAKEKAFKKVIPNRKLRAEQTVFSKKNPFAAPVFEKVQLHGKDSDRQTIHLELGLKDSGLEYLPGDAAGVWPVNPSSLIEEVLTITGLEADAVVEVAGETKTLYEALFRNVELSKITTDVVARYLVFKPNDKLLAISKNNEEFKAYLEGRDIVDLFQDFPAEITPQELIKLLKPLQARYYSISSSPDACPDELHLTVGVVNYKDAGRFKQGTCSTFLSEVLVEDEHVPIFIESNPGFRLPEDPQTPIIMVGAGTGIAPYRAFVQHRELSDNAGKSWLFFGNRNFESEFLYQTEWHKFLKSGALTKMDVAFSRDGDKKEYVQDRLLQNAEEVYNWLEDGAHVYICGDMNKMANDVQNALVKIAEEQGNLSSDGAQEYVDNLQKAKRLQLDVY